MNSSIEKFLKKISNDETLKKEMADAEQKMSNMDPEAGFNKFLKPIINKAGFDFSFEDLKKFQQQNMPQVELDDDALENVAGGFTVRPRPKEPQDWEFCFTTSK